MVLVITSAVTPNKNMRNLQIKDESERSKQYIEALNAIIVSGVVKKIVFCDNTKVDISIFEESIALAKMQGVYLEILSFQGDSENIVKYGKGYGEGEIIKYAIEKSKSIEKSKYILKLTGRLYIDNLKEICHSINKNRIYLNVPNKSRRDIVDTRFYGMPKEIYTKYFMDAYKMINDSKGYFMEHSFRDIVGKYNLKTYNFPKYPRYRGISGSSGSIYQYHIWKCYIKDILSKLQFYNIKWKYKER